MTDNWLQVLTILFANIGMFLWSRSEANSDRRMFYDLLHGMKEEMKDFHGRLCAIEERNKK